jgi:SSS family solute:Na+ symporter
MDNSTIALSVIFGIVLISSIVGMYAGGRYKMNLEQWTVAGRGFGLVLVWLLMAGEIYTTFAFLGASGWAYSRGGPTLYIMAYLTLAYVFSFYFLPQIWEVGKKYGMQTQSDFFHKRYNSKNLAAVASLIGVVFIIPYLQLQLTGLGIIVELASFNIRSACVSNGDILPPRGLGAALRLSFHRCTHLTAELTLMSKRSAASRRDAPSISTASITRSRRSPE